MDEAMESLAAAGYHLDMLRIRAFPFYHEVDDFAAAHDLIFVVEQNRDGQLRTLLVNECELDPASLIPVLHYDGTPVNARQIAQSIADHLDAAKVTPLRKAGS